MKKQIHIYVSLTLILLNIIVVGALGTLVFARSSEETHANILTRSEIRSSIRLTQKVKRRNSAYFRRLVVEADEQKALDSMADCIYTAPEKPEYQGEFIALETKTTADLGESFQTSIYLKNTGNVAWFGDFGPCIGKNKMRLGTARDRDRQSIFYNPGDVRWVNSERIAMIETRVNPGEIGTFVFASYTPHAADIFREYFQPVVDGIAWVEGTNTVAHVDVYAGNFDENYEKNLKYLGTSGQMSALDLSGEPIIEIDISDQKLIYRFGNTIVREFIVSTGTFHTPTPLGRFKILNKMELRIARAKPHYRMPMWQGFTARGHGLHSLPYLANDNGVFWEEALNHIGVRVSHGCVRMLPEEAEDLYELTEVGTTIIVKA